MVIDLPDGKKLQARELPVLRLTLQGMKATDAAASLFLSRRTVQAYMGEVHRKLGTHNAVQARRRLEELGLLDIILGKA